MKMIKVFVTPVVLMLFVLLPTMLHAAQDGINLRIGDDNDIGISGDKQERRQQGEVDHPMNESYGSSTDIFHTMVGKNPYQMYEDNRHPSPERDGMLNMGLQNPANHQLLTKSTERKIDAASVPLGTWKIEAVDAAKNFTTSNSRAIAVDAGNHPHIFYGGDHLYHAYHDGSKWNYETVDSSSGVGSSASVARDTSGKVHICYFDAVNQVLKYATNKLGFWIVTNVDSNPGDVNNPTISIALDTSGKVHICYSYNKGNVSERDLNYVTNVTGKWVTEIIVPNILGSYSLAGGTSGKAHISYYDATNQDLMYVTNSSGSWVTKTVDSSGKVGVFNSLAVDTSGNVHISYSDNTNGDLKYATNLSGSWVPETVDSSGVVGALNSLALDTSGKVHISYYDGTNQDLKYVTNGSGSWGVPETVDSNISFGPNSLALDTSGKAHICYYDTTNPSIPDIKYATNTSGSWVPETVESSGPNVGFGASLALDTSGNVHICYLDVTNGDLKYVTNGSGSWGVPETAVDSGGYNFALALDTSGNVHISYFANYALKYATNATGKWVPETVDSSGYVGLYSSLAVDTSGNVHISYYDYDNSAIKYVTKAMGSWGVPEIIATGVGIYGGPGSNSMALDKSGKVHVIYNEGSPNHDLKYVTNASGSWGVPETVDSNTTVGSPKSLALDTSGNVHICYTVTGMYGQDLKYATNALGFWTPMTVDIKVGYSSYSSSLGVDTLDNVHISYYDATNRALKYVSAAGTSGSWEMTTVDSSGDVGSSNSLALDTSGKVHIAYYDSANKDLKYATNAINKPTVKTRAATKMTDNSATLNGTVNAHNWTTRVWFQYGKKSGRYTKSSSKKTVYGSTDKKVRIGISGLTSQTEYYYRIVAKNRDGTTYGKQKSFITQ